MFTKEFVRNILVSIMVVVALFIGMLVLTAVTKGFENAKEIYQLVVVDTLVEPFVGIIAAFVAYTFGRNAAEVLHERNLMKNDKKANEYKIKLL